MNKRVALYLVVLAGVVASFAATHVTAQQPALTISGAEVGPGLQSQTPPASPPRATPPPGSTTPGAVLAFPVNVRVDVTITDQPGGSVAPIKKTISMTASRRSSVRSGVNIPIPSTVMSGGPGSTAPVTSYNYRTMGLSLDVVDVEVRDNQIRLNLNLEYSPLDDTEKPATPAATPVSYSNFQQSFQLVLENGKPILAAETSDPVPNRNRRLSVELKATILK